MIRPCLPVPASRPASLLFALILGAAVARVAAAEPGQGLPPVATAAAGASALASPTEQPPPAPAFVLPPAWADKPAVVEPPAAPVTEPNHAPTPDAPAAEPLAPSPTATSSATDPEPTSPASAPSEPPSSVHLSAASPASPASAATAAPDPVPPVNPELAGLLALGAALTDRSQYDDAEIAFRQVLKSVMAPPTDTISALLGLARLHRKQGALTKAAAIYERYLKDYPGDERAPEALLDLGRTLRGLGIYKTALARFYSVLTSTLKLPGEGFERYQQLAKTAQYEIAETHFQAGNFAEAGKFYTRLRLLDLLPADRARAHFKAAFSLHLQGDLEGATTMLRAYIEQSPDDENVPEARYLLATSLRQLKRTQDAFAATLELLRAEKSRVAADPKRWAYWQRRTGNQLANDFFETGNTLHAHAIYSGLLDLAPELTWRLPILYQIGLCHERLGSTDQARASYQAIVDAPGAAAAPEHAELVRMASWRLDHLAWRSKIGDQVSAFFETTTGKTPPTPLAATAPRP